MEAVIRTRAVESDLEPKDFWVGGVGTIVLIPTDFRFFCKFVIQKKAVDLSCVDKPISSDTFMRLTDICVQAILAKSAKIVNSDVVSFNPGAKIYRSLAGTSEFDRYIGV